MSTLIPLGPTLTGTVVVPNLGAALDAYTDFLHANVLERGEISAIQAKLWGKPRLEGSETALLCSDTGHPWLRLLGIPAQAPARPFLELGWMALEVLVDDVQAISEQLEASPFQIVRGVSDGVSSGAKGMQVTGPAGEVLYLTQVSTAEAPFHIEPARAPVERLLSPISACLRRDEGLAVYSKLGATRSWSFETTLGSVNRAHGLNGSMRHPCAAVKLAGHSMAEINQLGLARARPPSGGLLPGGIAVVSFLVDNLDTIAAKPISPPAVLSGKLYGGQRVAACRGAAGELIELIEAAA